MKLIYTKFKFFLPHLIIFISLPISGFFIGYKFGKTRQIDDCTSNKSVEKSQENNEKQVSTTSKQISFSQMNNIFIESPLLISLKGDYYNYGENKPKRFHSEITKLIIENSPQLKVIEENTYSGFSINIWQYEYSFPIFRYENQSRYRAYTDRDTVLMADIGIRARNNKYTLLTYDNLIKEFGRLNKDQREKTVVFNSNGNAVVITMQGIQSGPNAWDDSPYLQATMYVESPYDDDSINAVQLFVTVPSYMDTNGSFVAPYIPEDKSFNNYLKTMDAHIIAIVDIFNQIKYKPYKLSE